jgi:hypothetical protein
MSAVSAACIIVVSLTVTAPSPAYALCVYDEETCTEQCYRVGDTGFMFAPARGKHGTECSAYPRFWHDSAPPSRWWGYWHDDAAVPDGECSHEQKMMFYGHTLFGPAHPEGLECVSDGFWPIAKEKIK